MDTLLHDADNILFFPIPAGTQLFKPDVYAAFDSDNCQAPGSSWAPHIIDVTVQDCQAAVFFRSPLLAKQAFATRYNAAIPNTCPRLYLAFTYDSSPMSCPRHLSPIATQGPDNMYHELIQYGPIFRLTTSSVWFWEETDALKAEQSDTSAIRIGEAYHPRAVEITGCPESKRKALIAHLSLFGTVISFQYHHNGSLSVEFSTLESAEMVINALNGRLTPFTCPPQTFQVSYKPVYPWSLRLSTFTINALNSKLSRLEADLDLAKHSGPPPIFASQEQMISSLERLFIRADSKCEEQEKELDMLKQEVVSLRAELVNQPNQNVLDALKDLQRSSETLLARSLAPPPLPPTPPSATSKKLKDREASNATHYKFKILSLNRELRETKERLENSSNSSVLEQDLARQLSEQQILHEELLQAKDAELEEMRHHNEQLTVNHDYFYSMASNLEREKSEMTLELPTLRADIKNLKDELEEKSRSLATAIRQLDEAMVSKDRLQTTLDATEDEVHERERESMDLRNEMVNMHTASQKVQGMVEERNDTIRELEQEKDEMMMEISRLMSRVDDQREELRNMQEIVKATNDECSAKDESLQSAYAQIADKDASLTTCGKELTRCATQVDLNNTLMEELQVEIDEMHQEHKELQADLKKERTERKLAVEAQNKLHAKLSSLERSDGRALEGLLRQATERRKKDIVAVTERDSWVRDQEFAREDESPVAVGRQLRLNTNELMARAHRRAAEQGHAERMRRRPRGGPPSERRFTLVSTSDL